MIRSMTGYSRTESVLESGKLIVEIKALNHRYLDIFVHIPNKFFSVEGKIKKKTGERLIRGKIDVNVQIVEGLNLEDKGKLQLNLPLIHSYHSLLTQMRKELGLKDEVSLNMIAGLKDAFVPAEIEVDMEAVWRETEKTLDASIDALIEMREKEGDAIYRDFLSRLDIIRDCLNSVKSRVPQVISEYKKRLSARLKELLKEVELDEQRLCQEVAIMTEKSDITEEIVRFESHIGQFCEMLEGSGAVGRKMDFLLQEMNREVNTIGSKSSDVEIARKVIEIKDELSKLREQASNVE